MKVLIEKGVPMPELAPKYPWKQMVVGDSFEVKDKSVKTRNRLTVSAQIFGKAQSPAQKFSFRTTLKGFRCWRVK